MNLVSLSNAKIDLNAIKTLKCKNLVTEGLVIEGFDLNGGSITNIGEEKYDLEEQLNSLNLVKNDVRNISYDIMGNNTQISGGLIVNNKSLYTGPGIYSHTGASIVLSNSTLLEQPLLNLGVGSLNIKQGIGNAYNIRIHGMIRSMLQDVNFTVTVLLDDNKIHTHIIPMAQMGVNRPFVFDCTFSAKDDKTNGMILADSTFCYSLNNTASDVGRIHVNNSVQPTDTSVDRILSVTGKWELLNASNYCSVVGCVITKTY